MNSCIANNNNIIISFKYSIKKKKYTIDEKAEAKEKNNKIFKELFKKLNELSNTTWEELQNKPKEIGYEMIPISKIDINLENIKQELKISEDDKIIVMRFCNQKYRILGVRSQECNSILYIIGYDWDYSAYNHGS